jgi:uncharacterized membrane protein
MSNESYTQHRISKLDEVDRIVWTAIGGALLGGTLFAVHGAIIGGLLGALAGAWRNDEIRKRLEEK